MAESSRITIADSPSASSKNNEKKTSCNSCSIEEFAFNKYVSHLISRPFSTVYLTQDIDYGAANYEFDRFIHYIENYPEPGKSQLSSFLFPIFVHLYFLLLPSENKGDVLDAHEFYKHFELIFESAEGYKDILKELYELENVKNIKSHFYFKRFWEMKYIARVSPYVLQDLRSFLEKIESKALIYVLHFHFHYEDVDYIDMTRSKSCRNNEKSKTRNNQHIQSDAEKKFSSYMSDLSKKMLISKPRISAVIIGCKNSNLCSVDFNTSESQISIALGDPYVLISDLRRNELTAEYQETTHIDHTVSDMKKIEFLDAVSAVKYVSDEPDLLLVSCGMKDSCVKLLNTTTESLVSSFVSGHASSVCDIDVNSTASLFATASLDSSACLWNFNETEAVKKFLGHMRSINVVKFHPNGIYLMTGSSDSTLRMWSVENSLALRSFIGHESQILSIACSPDGKMLASGDSMGIVKIWDIKEGSKISEVACCCSSEPNLAKVTSICFSLDGSVLAACSYKGILRMWDVRRTANSSTKYFENTPLLIKFNKHGLWKMVLNENTYEI